MGFFPTAYAGLYLLPLRPREGRAVLSAGMEQFYRIPCTADGVSEEAAVGEVRRLLRTVD